jgi:hypothetical protein
MITQSPTGNFGSKGLLNNALPMPMAEHSRKVHRQNSQESEPGFHGTFRYIVNKPIHPKRVAMIHPSTETGRSERLPASAPPAKGIRTFTTGIFRRSNMSMRIAIPLFMP